MKKHIPEAGDMAPEFHVQTSEGSIFSLSAALSAGRNILLVFYRGHW